MACILTSRIIPLTCGRVILRSSSINAFYRKIPVQSIAILCAQKFKKNDVELKPNQFSVSAIRQTSTEAEQAGHDHVKHWTAERILSAVLIGAIPAAWMFPSSALEYFLALSLTVHSHWGVEAIVLDYVRPSYFGKFIPKLAVATVYGLSALTLGGLFYFIYTDVGLVNAVKLLWKL